MTVRARIEAVHSDRYAAARASGIPVVGLIGAGIPAELVLAAGGFPLMLAAQAGDRDLDSAPMEAAHEAEIRSLFRQGMAGDFGGCDLVVIASTSDGYRYLFQYLREMVRIGEGAMLPPLLLHDVLFGETAPVRDYSRKVTAALRDRLASLVWRTVSNGDIAEAIQRTNAVRTRLARIAELRRERRIVGDTASLAIAAGGFMLPEAHVDLLDAVIAAAGPPSAAPRLLIETAVPLYHDALHAAVEAGGGFVVAEDDAWGARRGGAAIVAGSDPIDALCEHGRLYAASPRQPTPGREAWYAAQLGSGIEGVVFYVPPEDQFFGWRYPALATQAEAAGIPTLLLRDDALDAAGSAAITAAVSDFVATLESKA